MRNNTIPYNYQATPQQILGQLNGSSVGPQSENKKKTVQRSRLLKAKNLFQLDPTYGKMSSISIVSIIIQKELVMFHGNTKIWKEAGNSTVQNQIYLMIRNKEIPTIRSKESRTEGKYSICHGALMVNPDVIRVRLLELPNWDLKINIDNWIPHKVTRNVKPGQVRKPTLKKKKKMNFFRRLLFLFFPNQLS